MGKLLVVQTDSTITFSGPDTHLRVKTTLERFSEWESGDGAVGIYRISSQSLARAANSGMMGEEVLAFLEKHSSGVPQNVEFEVDAQLKGLPRVTLKQDGLEFVLMSEDPNVLRMIRTDIARYVSSPTHKDGVSLVPRQCKRAKDRLIERGYLIRDEVGEENYPTVSLESLEKKLELPAEVIGAIEGIHVYDGYVADNEELKTRIREYEGATFEKMKKFRSFLPAEHQTSLNWRFPSMKGYRSWTGTKRMGKALGFLDFVATHDFLAEAGGRDIFQFLQHGYPHLNENEFLAILQGLGKEYSKKKSVAECYCLPEEVVERLPGIVWTMLGKDTYAEDGRSLQDAVAVFESEVGKKMRQWKAFLPKENREKLEERYTAAGDDRRQTFFGRGEHLKCLSLLEIIASHDFKKLAGNLTLGDYLLKTEFPHPFLSSDATVKVKLNDSEIVAIAHGLGENIALAGSLEEEFSLPIEVIAKIPGMQPVGKDARGYYLTPGDISRPVGALKADILKKAQDFDDYLPTWYANSLSNRLRPEQGGYIPRMTRTASNSLLRMINFLNAVSEPGFLEASRQGDPKEYFEQKHPEWRAAEIVAAAKGLGYEYRTLARAGSYYALPFELLSSDERFSLFYSEKKGIFCCSPEFMAALKDFENEIRAKTQRFKEFIPGYFARVISVRYGDDIDYDNLETRTKGAFPSRHIEFLDFLDLLEVSNPAGEGEDLLSYIARVNNCSVRGALTKLKNVGLEFEPIGKIAKEYGIPTSDLEKLAVIVPTLYHVKTPESTYFFIPDQETLIFLSSLASQYRRAEKQHLHFSTVVKS